MRKIQSMRQIFSWALQSLKNSYKSNSFDLLGCSERQIILHILNSNCRNIIDEISLRLHRTSLRLVFKYMYFTKENVHKDRLILQPYFGLLNYFQASSFLKISFFRLETDNKPWSCLPVRCLSQLWSTQRENMAVLSQCTHNAPNNQPDFSHRFHRDGLFHWFPLGEREHTCREKKLAVIDRTETKYSL